MIWNMRKNDLIASSRRAASAILASHGNFIHDEQHLAEVERNALAIAKSMHASERELLALRLAAHWHDTGREDRAQKQQGHERASLKHFEAWAKGQSLEETLIKEVGSAIAEHRNRGNAAGPENRLAKILWDADKLCIFDSGRVEYILKQYGSGLRFGNEFNHADSFDFWLGFSPEFESRFNTDPGKKMFRERFPAFRKTVERERAGYLSKAKNLVIEKNMTNKLSPYVKTIKLPDGTFVLNHALSMEQIYFKDKAFLGDAKNRQLLQDKGFLDDGVADAEAKKKILSNSSSGEYNLLRILLTDLCNLECRYCKVCHNTDDPLSSPAPLDKVRKAVDALFSKSSMPKTIHITGGEPLLFFQEVKAIVDYIVTAYPASAHEYIIVLGTNGVLLDDEKVAFLKKHDIKAIISLDGDKKANALRVMKNGMPSYDYAVKAIRKLKEAGVETGVSMVIGKHNVDYAEQCIEMVARKFRPSSIGVNFIKNTKLNEKSTYLISGKEYADRIYAVHQRGRRRGVFLELLARKIFPFVYQEYRLYDCGASNGTTINIDASGNVGTCKSFLCLKTHYTDSDIEKIIDKFKDRSPLHNSYCADCVAQGICGNGCAYEAKINDEKNIIDKRACEYVISFYEKFLEDLLASNRAKAEKAIKRTGYYIPSVADRERILGKVFKDRKSLKQCIGHEI